MNLTGASVGSPKKLIKVAVIFWARPANFIVPMCPYSNRNGVKMSYQNIEIFTPDLFCILVLVLVDFNKLR